MDGPASSIIEGGEVVEPAIAVPGPAGNRAVDDSGPDEGEDHGGEETTALKGTTNHNLYGSNAEKALEEGEEDWIVMLVNVRSVWKEEATDFLGCIRNQEREQQRRCGDQWNQSYR